MPFVPTPCTQVNFRYTWDGQLVENVVHYTDEVVIPGPIDVAAIPAYAALMVAAWNTIMKSAMPATLALTSLVFTDLSAIDGYSVTYGTGLPLVGTSSSPSLPNNCALVLTKRTVKRGRAFRGRIYQPGLTESIVTGNSVSGGAITTFISFWEDIRELVSGGDTIQMVVPHRYVGIEPLPAGTVEVITGFTSEGVVDSQRRRLPGRGA